MTRNKETTHIRIFGYEVSDSSGEEQPLRGVGRVVVVLDVLLVGHQHLDLELQKLLPEGELRGAFWYELSPKDFPLDRPLVFVICEIVYKL